MMADGIFDKGTTSFAKRLNEICQMEVREARDNDCVATGMALIAPGNRHMLYNNHPRRDRRHAAQHHLNGFGSAHRSVNGQNLVGGLRKQVA
jgi:chemotaxis response regulator CheB